MTNSIRSRSARTLSMAVGGLLLASAANPGLAQVVSYKGIAYDADDQSEVLYLESHYLQLGADGEAQERLVLYRCPDGLPFARKRVDHAADPLKPSFEMFDARLGYTEGLENQAGDDLVYFQKGANERRRSERLALTEQAVADAGFDEFVRRNWTELQSGKKLPLDFLVPSRLSVYSFKVQKTHSHEVDGEPASVFRLGLSGVLGWFVSGIDVTYRDRDQALLQFEGLSNVRDPAGDNYVARIVFPDADRLESADPQAFEAARSEPLVSQCVTG